MSIFSCKNGEKYTLQGMIAYITDPTKTTPNYIFTTGTDMENMLRDALFIQLLFYDAEWSHKNKAYVQFITTLSENDISSTSLSRFCQYITTLHWILSRWAGLPQAEFQVITAIHFDKSPIYHAHTIIPTISAKDGHIFPWENKHFWLLRNLVNQLLIYYGFTRIEDERLNERSRLPKYFPPPIWNGNEKEDVVCHA